MVGKLTAVLIRKEAEAYRSQGLHEEAFALYDELLSSHPNIDETLKADIQSQMDIIAEEIEAFSSRNEEQLLSSKEMMQLKNGWDNGASPEDMLISAQGLCQIGAHRDALIEFEKILKSGIAPEQVADSTMESFLNIYEPKKLPNAAEKWLRDIYSEEKKVLAVHLLFLRALSRRSDKTYVFQYCRFIRSKPSLPPNLIERLDAAQEKYKLEIKQGKMHRSDPKSDFSDEPAAKFRMTSDSKERDIAAFSEEEDLGEGGDSGTLTINGPMDKRKDSLKAIFAESTYESLDDEISEPDTIFEKEGKNQLNAVKMIIAEWFDRILKIFLMKKRKKASR